MERFILPLLVVITLLSCQKETQKSQPITQGDFIFSSEQIDQNQPFTINYTGDGELENGFYHALVDEKSYTYDLEFEGNKTSLTVPDSIGMVSFFFTIDKELDVNNGEGYLFFTTNTQGDVAEDARAIKENYLVNEGSFYDIEGGDYKSALLAIETLIKNHEDQEETWFGPLLRMSSRVNKAKTEDLVENYIDKTKSDGELGLEGYSKIGTIYASARYFEKRDSINGIISDKFPDSEEAKKAIVENYFNYNTFEEKIEYFKNKGLESFSTDNMNFVYVDLANMYFRKDDRQNFEEYVGKINKVQNKSSMLNNIAWNSAEKGKDLEYAAKLSKQSLDLVSKEKEELRERNEFFSPNQYKKRLDYDYKMYADTYAYIQYQLGNLDTAIDYQEKVIGEGYNPEYNERYIQFLSEAEDYERVVEKASVFISEGNATKNIKDYLKTAYKKTSPNTDVESIFAQLEKEADEKLKRGVKKKLLNEDATNFAVKNLDGEEVSLDSYRGKTVILDFWATWCGPCISSFPGMQEAITKYEDNDDVVFLFVDTFENGKTREESVQNFIDKNNYDFHVLIDPYSKDTSTYQIASAYNVSGIPTKVIIDKEGKMRFKDVGFSGSTDKLVSKLDVMIELVQ